MDYLSYSYFLTNITPRKGSQEQPDSGLLVISQLEQVYGVAHENGISNILIKIELQKYSLCQAHTPRQQ